MLDIAKNARKIQEQRMSTYGAADVDNLMRHIEMMQQGYRSGAATNQNMRDFINWWVENRQT